MSTDVLQISDLLGDALSEFIPKKKENKFFCDRCWDFTTYSKTVFMYRTPKIMVMHIDRFRVE